MYKNLREFLRELFVRTGWEVMDREPEEFIWLKTDEGIELVYVEMEKTVDGDYIIQFCRNTEQLPGEKIIMCVRDVTRDAYTVAEKYGVVIYNRTATAKFIGDGIIELYEKGMLSALPIFDEDDIEVEKVEEEEESEEIEEDVIPIFLEDVATEGEERVIKPKITEEDAYKIARNYVRGSSMRMIYIPFYVFEYSVEVMIEGLRKYRLVTGVIAVNGLDSECEIWKHGYETTNASTVDVKDIEPKIGLEEAREVAARGVIDKNTKSEEVKVEHENATIIEKRKVVPNKSTLKLNFMGLYYLPVWVIEGLGGMVMINAATGEIIKDSTR